MPQAPLGAPRKKPDFSVMKDIEAGAEDDEKRFQKRKAHAIEVEQSTGATLVYTGHLRPGRNC